MIRVRIVARGMVQGVFFRHNARQMARKLRLKGFVRNLIDGGVEIVVEGHQSQIEELAAFCRKGPESAVVDSLEMDEEPYKGEFTVFDIRY